MGNRSNKRSTKRETRATWEEEELRPVISPLPVTILPAAIKEPEKEPTKEEDRFSVRRTTSEAGHVRWILEGHGKYKCFVLCDSWADAIDQAKRRTNSLQETVSRTEVIDGYIMGDGI